MSAPDELAARARALGIKPELLRAAEQRQADRHARRASLDTGTAAERVVKAAHFPNDVPKGRR